MSTVTLGIDDNINVIAWPACEADAPAGWHWGAHVSLGSRGTGSYMIRDADDATLIALQRPDIQERPTVADLHEALRPRGEP